MIEILFYSNESRRAYFLRVDGIVFSKFESDYPLIDNLLSRVGKKKRKAPFEDDKRIGIKLKEGYILKDVIKELEKDGYEVI